jgi:hypothetical protein
MLFFVLDFGLTSSLYVVRFSELCGIDFIEKIDIPLITARLSRHLW